MTKDKVTMYVDEDAVVSLTSDDEDINEASESDSDITLSDSLNELSYLGWESLHDSNVTFMLFICH